MARVLMMKQASERAMVSFLKFMQLIAKNRADTICFFEGEDQKYYVARINLLASALNWHGIDCAGKANVLDLHKLITEHKIYKNSLVAFFVDKDFDAPLPQEIRNKIYETPCYSIENFYCTDTCLSKVLSIEFKLENNPDKPNLHAQVIEHFKRLREQFHTHMRLPNIWIKAHRKKELLEGAKSLNLNNVSLDKFVQITQNQVTGLVTSTDDVSRYFPDGYQLSENEVENENKIFPVSDPHLHFRGKYQLEFVRQYLTNLRQECNDTSSKFYNPKNAVKLSFSKRNFISELSQYADTPQCLNEFLGQLG